jgi:diacylglycerol kinase
MNIQTTDRLKFSFVCYKFKNFSNFPCFLTQYLFFHQHNAWIHLVAAAVAVFLGFFLKITVTEWLFVVAAIGFVLSAEAFNTAIEQLVDRVSPEKNPEAGRIKDIGAGAVLLAAATALVIGLVIFLPKIF